MSELASEGTLGVGDVDRRIGMLVGGGQIRDPLASRDLRRRMIPIGRREVIGTGTPLAVADADLPLAP